MKKPSQRCLGETAAARKAMQHTGRRTFVRENAGDLGIGFAGMDDQRQAGCPRRCDVGAKDPLLDVARAQIVMKIEPGFAEADDLWMRAQRDQPLGQQVGVVGRFVRMSANRAPDAGIGLGDREHPWKFVEPGCDCQHCSYTGSAGAGNDLSAFVGKVREIQMAMAVNQHCRPAALVIHAADASTNRGKIPAGFGSGVPGVNGAHSSARKSRDPCGTESWSNSRAEAVGTNGCAKIAR